MKSGFYLRLALSLGLMSLLFIQMDHHVLVNWWHSKKAPDISLFLLSTILVMTQIFFLNLRWHEYLNAGHIKIPLHTSILMNIAGYFANILFITSVGGMIAKSGLAVRHGLSVTHAIFATVLDRFMTLFALIVLSAVGLPFLVNTIDQKISIMLFFIIFMFVLSFSIPLLALRAGLFKNFVLAKRGRSRFVAVLRNFAENYDMMTKTTIYSLIAQILFVLSVYVLSWGIEAPEGATIQLLALLPVVALISSLPIGFGGWGIRESAFVYGLKLIGYMPEESFILSIQVGLVGLIAPFIYGIPYILRNDFKEFLGIKNRNFA